MKTKSLLIILLTLSIHSLAQIKIPFYNTELTFEERADDIIPRLTLEEKVSLLVYNSPAIERLGIHEYNWWNEALHGVARNGIATVFPQAIGLASTWDKDLIFKVASVISDEARAKYNIALSRNQRGIYQGVTLWSPNINIFRDPRWGRGMETYGEDPFLTGEIGVQFVKGLQGNDPRYLKTIATPKHFAVHSGPESERHTFNAIVSDYDLYETYLPHFKKCVKEGNAYSVMCAYNRFRGDACCGSDPLIKQILRDEWNFKGLMVSDCWAVPDMYNFHKIVSTPEEAASIAVKAGTDLECGNSYPALVNAVKQGLISEKEIDVSLKRVLVARLKLGMFDPPEMVPFSKLLEYDTPYAKSLALETAKKSIVLLKNQNNILPLSKEIKNIAVIGPNADDVEVLLGNYNGFPSSPVTPLLGIKDKLKNANVVYERGCDLAENMPSFDIIESKYLFTSESLTQNGLVGEYFSNRDFTGKPAFTRIDNKVDFAWWDGAPDKSFNPENFGIKWSGYIKPDKSGKYFLGGYGFNGFRIYIEDSLFVAFDGEFDPVKTYKEIELTAGKAYKIKIEFYKKLRYSFMQFIWNVADENREQRAIDAAKNSDVVIMFMGLSPRLEGEEMKVEVEGFHGGDRLTLDLPKMQSDLIKKIYSTGKPIVLVLLNGSALSINWENEHLPAIVEAWYPGQAAGTAISDILFGDYNPAGRLPVTFYKSVDQLPAFNNYNMDGRTYRYFTGKPLYEFGYGLSYTTFEYSNLLLSNDNISANGSTSLFVDVKNTGKVKGEEVIQLYIKPVDDYKLQKSLKGFNRITLEPGENKTVEFKITPQLLERWAEENGMAVQSGKYVIMVGSSSDNMRLKTVELSVCK